MMTPVRSLNAERKTDSTNGKLTASLKALFFILIKAVNGHRERQNAREYTFFFSDSESDTSLSPDQYFPTNISSISAVSR